MPNILYKASAVATGGREGRVQSSDGSLDLRLALPKELGGPGGTHPNPEILFAAGYAACFDSALQFVARTRRVRPGATRVEATVCLNPDEAGGFGLSVSLAVQIPDVTREQAQQLLEAAHKICPYSDATRGNIPVELSLA
jgi:Ohr subfamily peroxiredoxin